jgi:hypothetical protein
LLGCSKAHRSAFAIAVERKWYERISQGVWFHLYLPRRDWSESELENRRGLLWLVRFAKICVLWQTLPN